MREGGCPDSRDPRGRPKYLLPFLSLPPSHVAFLLLKNEFGISGQKSTILPVHF